MRLRFLISVTMLFVLFVAWAAVSSSAGQLGSVVKDSEDRVLATASLTALTKATSDSSQFLSGSQTGETVSKVASSLDSTFMIEENPFNPDRGNVGFRWNQLGEPSQVEIRIFTLTGELVLYESSYRSGSAQEEWRWDGRNDSGHMVLNGVYVVCLSILDVSREVRIKVAVLR